MHESYCSFEVAKLLKEKGFDWDCGNYYKPDGEIVRTLHTNGSRHINSSVLYENQCLAPTQQMALRWLREEYYIDILPLVRHVNKFAGELPIKEYSYRIYDGEGNVMFSGRDWFRAYEKSIEAALEYAIKNLI